MKSPIARMHRRQKRHLEAIATNDRIRTLAGHGRDINQICKDTSRGTAYVRRIAGWRLTGAV